jgi:site-specific DNA-adenine methylase
MANYGLPYMGSKDSLMGKLGQIFPAAENFYDLFGGGFSVTHFMAWNYRTKFKRFFYNEIKSDVVELVKDAIEGKYNYNVFKPEWIDRETFHAKKAEDAYIRCLWSFGNDQHSYLFGKDIEPYKRSLHNAVVFGLFDATAKNVLGFSEWPKELSIRGRRLLCRKITTEKYCKQKKNDQMITLQQLERLKQLQQLERLQQLQQLITLQQLQQLINFSSKSYDQVEILPNSVVYCDPPYDGTKKYVTAFDHDKFWQWAREQSNPVFISEYNAPKDFHVIAAFSHKKKLTNTGVTGSLTDSVEKLFANDAAKALMK